jgi:hypothetical protein
MTTLGGGWTRLFRYRAGDPCPGRWVDATRGCRRQGTTGGNQTSAAVVLPHAVQELRGTVRAFGFGVADGFDAGGFGFDVDDNYVDGLVISQGLPRRHVFTLAHGCTDAFSRSGVCTCPCSGGRAAPDFVGTNFRCESPGRSADPNNTSTRFYDFDDLLFDDDVIDESSCRGQPQSAPDFLVDLGTPSADPLELRLLGDEGTTNEDLAVVDLELWGR